MFASNRPMLTLSALALLALVPFAGAQEEKDKKPESAVPPRSRIIDEAGLLKKATVEEATRTLEAAERQSSVPIVIEAVPSLKGASPEDAALRAARLAGGQGLFVFIARDERALRVLTRRQFEHRFPEDRRNAIREAFLKGFGERDFDEGLTRGVQEIVRVLKETAPAEGTSPLVVRNQIHLTLAGARKAIAASEAKAAEMKLKVNIAVVDDGGHLLAFERMDGARPGSAATAHTKAVSAATMRAPTGPIPPGTTSPDLVVNLGLPGAAAAGGGRITTLFGGIPIVIDGQVVGAVGVGGGSGEQDAEVARAGASAVAEEAKSK